MINIGERIIQLRKARNWSQDDLAKRVEASRVMIGKYERDDNSPSVEVIVKLAKATGCFSGLFTW
ncbi:helix-turn-helix domain-containing protein [Pedobacter hiemivivus]|uniref:helix-turn-helix domain-containing protein n=1 Tax=Pedobacter hiemivivus TaxID=2530454 RepID=UPI0019819287|nr:helix-turn-helix transcriptional regulator [Pedobacter hiemivivus]